MLQERIHRQIKANQFEGNVMGGAGYGDSAPYRGAKKSIKSLTIPVLDCGEEVTL